MFSRCMLRSQSAYLCTIYLDLPRMSSLQLNLRTQHPQSTERRFRRSHNDSVLLLSDNGHPGEHIPKKTMYLRAKQVLSCRHGRPGGIWRQVLDSRVPSRVEHHHQDREGCIGSAVYHKGFVAVWFHGAVEKEKDKGETYRHDGSDICQALMAAQHPVVLVLLSGLVTRGESVP